MAKIINIHTGEIREEERIPDPECTICKAEFSLEDEGGTAGYFGITPVFFCMFCLSSMFDMVGKLTGDKDD
tara:strand:+ start:1436 stop:1648 length:213 start_codon:yes stop_codon:yes gene_type:complete